MSTEQMEAVRRLVKRLEDSSFELLESWLSDVRASNPDLAFLQGEEIKPILYSLVLRVIQFLGESERVAVLHMGESVDLKQVFYEAASYIVEAIEAQTEYMVGHCKRVRQTAGKVAAMLNLPDEQIEEIEYAAGIHNIGLINDAQRLYLEPRRLTEEELRRARNHCVVGAEMIRPIEFMSRIVPMILYHHTHYDGSGYPGGVAGEQIPIGARIIHICDALHAMISPRPYRVAMTLEEALHEIDRGAGKQFDPKLIAPIHAVAQELRTQ
ncbi:MAG: HD domain-containing phosphohydrolase [Armatimonadota bacterium]|nr:HD domain-containing protein [Armatimonadota bacterium]MCX7778236.1 HD domain-containing protein [Armatimonadota bacterium]MDW8024953.1 HD domain-containing phosphohydrolase [Armatimonadota bacterium]